METQNRRANVTALLSLIGLNFTYCRLAQAYHLVLQFNNHSQFER
jgi:hypothetical protein